MFNIPSKPTAANLQVLTFLGAVNLEDVKRTVTTCPGVNDVYVVRKSDNLKVNYLRSLWVGVFMTLINLPFILFTYLIWPLLRTVASSIVAVTAVTFTRIWAGLAGRVIAFTVEPEDIQGALIKKVLTNLKSEIASKEPTEEKPE